ncbi:MAG: Tat pathway signal protein [Flavobacteriaceae bacterium]|nr:MAG: Tat pathway signal protein [Flavobacteriaceae bacterium]
MDRRKSIKSILLGTVAGGLAVSGCKPGTGTEGDNVVADGAEQYFGRTPAELEQIAALNAEQFFNEHEMSTLAVLCDLILPANSEYGGATDAGVPDFIEFMVKDIPDMQPTLRGGLMWLDHKSNTDFNSEFKSLNETQQKEILDTIAYPDMEIPNNERPLEIQFFTLMRNMTLTGYYTSQMGIKDLGYKGNTPNVWDGIPEEVLAQHGVSYDEEWIAKCVDQSQRNVIAKWDEEGNLLT